MPWSDDIDRFFGPILALAESTQKLPVCEAKVVLDLSNKRGQLLWYEEKITQNVFNSIIPYGHIGLKSI